MIRVTASSLGTETVAIHRASSTDARARLRARQSAQSKFKEYVDWVHAHPAPRWVFRGQGRQWPLRPSVGRLGTYLPEKEVQLFREFQRAALPMVDRSQLTNDWDWLALAQHFGLPTRLIDWSTNALVAAFFASERSARGRSNGEVIAVSAREVGFYQPDREDTPDPFSIGEARFLKPSAVASRITMQRGLFSVHPLPDKPWRLRDQTDTFIVPGDMKAEFRRSLFGMGVDEAFLMADLEGLSRTLRWRLENGALGE